jgi:hypothetical protein
MLGNVVYCLLLVCFCLTAKNIAIWISMKKDIEISRRDIIIISHQGIIL